MKAIWRSLEYNYREGGIRQILRKIPWRIQQWLNSETQWLIYQVPTGRRKQESQVPLERVEMDFDQLRQFGYFKALAFPEGVQARLQRGARCHGFFLNGELANIAWTTKGHLELEGDFVIPCEDGAGIYDCWTVPRFRGRGIYPETLRTLVEILGNEGSKTVLIAVDPVNAASIKGITRAGFEPYIHLIRSRRFGRSVTRRQPFGQS